MSVQARINELFGGGGTPTVVNVTSATQVLGIPDVGSWIQLSNTTAGSITIGASNAVFSSSVSSRNRLIFLYNQYSTSGQSVVITNTDNTTTSGYCDLGGNNITLGLTDVLCLYIRSDGSAVRVFNTDN
jgi:hypothetical protein